jgi:hypothetical protein
VRLNCRVCDEPFAFERSGPGRLPHYCSHSCRAARAAARPGREFARTCVSAPRRCGGKHDEWNQHLTAQLAGSLPEARGSMTAATVEGSLGALTGQIGIDPGASRSMLSAISAARILEAAAETAEKAASAKSRKSCPGRTREGRPDTRCRATSSSVPKPGTSPSVFGPHRAIETRWPDWPRYCFSPVHWSVVV